MRKKIFPIEIPLVLKAALGDPQIAHALLGAAFSSQRHVGNSMMFPLLELASGIVLWDTQRRKCNPHSLDLQTGLCVTGVNA